MPPSPDSARDSQFGAAPPHPGGKRSKPACLARLLFGLVCLALVSAVFAVGGGFLWFVHKVPDREAALDERADGIVVLTGGTSRIEDAMQLLAGGRGKRLLISGVHRNTTPREIIRLVPQYEELVACCVDLDYSALNTVGNAAETRRWARDRNFRSLIVVTSSYHIPRSMAELEHQLGNIRLIAFPVVTEKLRSEPWWSNAATARLLFSEYLKYMAAQVRIRLEPSPESSGLARASVDAGS
jgi:uncharacterized SAM-binding protein YcdF (DUF218 family)